MPNVYYYGKTTRFVGKTLFEILANLRNFGVNRMLIKQEELLKNPGKKCYYIVKKVEPVMDEKLQEGAIYAERVFCNTRIPETVFVDEQSWHTDWQLVPKDEEHLYLVGPDELDHGLASSANASPRYMKLPPLMDIFMRRHYEARGGVHLGQVKMGSPIQVKM